LDEIPEALVDTRRRLSLVWVIPLAALIAAIWLAYQANRERGPLVRIEFNSAEGLEARKTPLRYKDVDVGQVEAITLSSDLSKVLVMARLTPNLEGFLTDETKFWIVRPRFSAGQVSGLSTLVGGAYIGVDLVNTGNPTLRFVGLEEPPVVDSTVPGSAFTLRTDSLRSLQIGSPIYFRNLEVGQVTGYALDDRSDVVLVQAFIRTPHDRLVTSNTRFWHTSGFEVSLGAEGLGIRFESLASFLLGGIVFGNLPDPAPGAPVAAGATFQLFSGRQAAARPEFTDKVTWILEFPESVRGLLPGAPVEFRGMQIGEVKAVKLQFDVEDLSARVPVLIDVEPERVELINAPAERLSPPDRRALWDALVARGLRAQLKSANLLTGALYVDFDFYPYAKPGQIIWDAPYPKLPAVKTPLSELNGIIAKLAQFPVEDLFGEAKVGIGNLNTTLEHTQQLLVRLDQQVAPELTRTLTDTRKAIRHIETLLRPNSALQVEAQQLLRELGAAARSLRLMADYLERHPEAILRGKGTD
jgi:paraquat-inducible protein B